MALSVKGQMVAARIEAGRRQETCEHEWDDVSARDQWCPKCGMVEPRGAHLMAEADRAMTEARWAVDRLGEKWRAAERWRAEVREELGVILDSALKVMTADELARRVGVSRQTLYNWIGPAYGRRDDDKRLSAEPPADPPA